MRTIGEFHPLRLAALCSAAAAFAILPLTGSQGQADSARPLRIVIPVPPAGAGDIVGRELAEEVSRISGLSVTIENRAGAATVIGTESVARALPDGNTLLLTAPYFLISPQLRKVNYDPLSDFAPICHLVSSPGVFAVNSASPYRTFADLIEAARARPGALTFASVGPGTPHHIGFEMLKRAAKVDLTYVPFPGGGPAINALLGGHVAVGLAEYAPLSAHLRAGTLRALATSARARIAQLPDVPTVAELGYRDYEVDMWWSVFAPAKTPPARLSELARWFSEALQSPELAAKFAAQGFSPVGRCGADFAAMLRRQYEDYGRVIREAHLAIE
jgi:tripartite-type tricarboxylate transporter receptor subunit TctC